MALRHGAIYSSADHIPINFAKECKEKCIIIVIISNYYGFMITVSTEYNWESPPLKIKIPYFFSETNRDDYGYVIPVYTQST